MPVFRSKPWNGNETLFWEPSGNRAVRKGDWKIVSAYPKNTWELYNIKSDRSELNDLSTKHINKVKELEGLYNEWANRAGVLPWAEVSK